VLQEITVYGKDTGTDGIYIRIKIDQEARVHYS
jgi:hypothetical protein